MRLKLQLRPTVVGLVLAGWLGAASVVSAQAEYELCGQIAPIIAAAGDALPFSSLGDLYPTPPALNAEKKKQCLVNNYRLPGSAYSTNAYDYVECTIAGHVFNSEEEDTTEVQLANLTRNLASCAVLKDWTKADIVGETDIRGTVWKAPGKDLQVQARIRKIKVGSRFKRTSKNLTEFVVRVPAPKKPDA